MKERTIVSRVIVENSDSLIKYQTAEEAISDSFMKEYEENKEKLESYKQEMLEKRNKRNK